MSITANIRNYIQFSGDQDSEIVNGSGDLLNSPAMVELVTLNTGDNELPVPSIDGFTVHGVVIEPPDYNLEGMTLKGAALDTGIALSASLPTILQFGATPPASIFVSVEDNVVGLRLVWF